MVGQTDFWMDRQISILSADGQINPPPPPQFFRQMGRLTDKETDTYSDGQTEKQKERNACLDRQTTFRDRYFFRQTNRHFFRQTNRHFFRQLNINNNFLQTDRQTGTFSDGHFFQRYVFLTLFFQMDREAN